MKIKIIEDAKVIISNRENSFNKYFAWPSVERLPDGRLAAVASGFRFGHVCPFGKAVISYSSDEGKTWTKPAPVIDTPLDDRDAGIKTFGNGKVIVTSFNNTYAFQRKNINSATGSENDTVKNYISAYLDMAEKRNEAEHFEEKYYGSTYVISNDGGNTFGEVKKIPVTAPHGPNTLPDGRLIYVGTRMDLHRNADEYPDTIECHISDLDGNFEYVSSIPNVKEHSNKDEILQSHEPHVIVLPDGRILVHIRTEPNFTLFQSESTDGGKTFSEPVRLLPDIEGAPSHLMLHSSGKLIATYGYRRPPYGIKVMVSEDLGKTWCEKALSLYETHNSPDLGYPCSVELKDGSILTVFYARSGKAGFEMGVPCEIYQTIWKLED